MAKISTASFEGASGTKYSFDVFTVDTVFPAVGAVYVFTRRIVTDGQGSHTLLYIGQTDNLLNRIPTHEKWPCVKRNSGNAICIHLDSNERSRITKETGLRNANTTPCNDQ